MVLQKVKIMLGQGLERHAIDVANKKNLEIENWKWVQYTKYNYKYYIFKSIFQDDDLLKIKFKM